MALYFYFNETTGDLVYSDQATYSGEGYTSLGQQTNVSPSGNGSWVFNSKRSDIKTVNKDPSASDRIDVLKSMDSMFMDCSTMVSADLDGFDTSNVTDMDSMFYDCNALTSLDISNFDTSNVTIMNSMFNGCSALTSLDLSHFDTSNVTEMQNIFNGCEALVDLDISSFDTSNATGMVGMFSGCSSLISLDLSHFDTSNATVEIAMFYDCSSLVSLNLSNFDLSNATTIINTFTNCSSLRIIDMSRSASKMRFELPAATYYDAVTRQAYAKADIPGGSTYVRDLADLDLVATMVQTRMGINVAKRLAYKALKKSGSIDVGGSSVDVVRTEQHQTSYDRDTLEIVTDSTGKVTAMYFVSA